METTEKNTFHLHQAFTNGDSNFCDHLNGHASVYKILQGILDFCTAIGGQRPTQLKKSTRKAHKSGRVDFSQGAIKGAVEVVNSSMRHLIHCKNFHKWYNVLPPSITIKKVSKKAQDHRFLLRVVHILI
jgi:hypothetical protein